MITEDQNQQLLSYMAEHPEFAKGHICKLGPQGHSKFNSMWKDLTRTLNQLGPPKSVLDWKNLWNSKKLGAKKKRGKYLNEKRKTGNKQITVTINDEEEKVCSIFNNFDLELFQDENIGFGSKLLTSSSEFNEKRLTQREKEELVVFMENNPEYTDGSLFSPQRDTLGKWHNFCANLKITNNSDKNADSYANSWNYLKNSVRKSFYKNQSDSLSSLDKRIYRLVMGEENVPSPDNSNANTFKSRGTSIFPVQQENSKRKHSTDFQTDNDYKKSKDDFSRLSTKSISPDSPDDKSKGTITLENLKSKLDEDSLDLSVCCLQSVPVSLMLQLNNFNRLVLSDNAITTLPAEFCTMTFLKKIDLRGNMLISLPNEIGNLFQLNYLNLQDNMLEYLPISMANLNKLQYLNLARNPLNAEISSITGNCNTVLECKACADNVIKYCKEKKLALEKDACEEIIDITDAEIIDHSKNVLQVQKNILETVNKILQGNTDRENIQRQILMELKNMSSMQGEILTHLQNSSFEQVELLKELKNVSAVHVELVKRVDNLFDHLVVNQQPVQTYEEVISTELINQQQE